MTLLVLQTFKINLEPIYVHLMDCDLIRCLCSVDLFKTCRSPLKKCVRWSDVMSDGPRWVRCVRCLMVFHIGHIGHMCCPM